MSTPLGFAANGSQGIKWVIRGDLVEASTVEDQIVHKQLQGLLILAGNFPFAQLPSIFNFKTVAVGVSVRVE